MRLLNDIRIYTPDEFPIDDILKIPRAKRKPGNQGGKKSDYRDIITAFDIETTRLSDIEQSFMYIWSWAFGHEMVVYGRTWDEFLQFARQLQQNNLYTVVYVHNLSYEFQFLRGIYDFQPTDVFAVERRKILKCTMFDALEFRCSYLHSNMSLDEFTRKMFAAHSKLSGVDFDYSKTRYPWTPLTDDELLYSIHDVVGLVESIENEMRLDGDNIYTIPLTSTGYVRRDAKRAMKNVHHSYVPSIYPDADLYIMLRQAFRGGNTHANRIYAGDILQNVKSCDRVSSYPDVLCNCKFPISRFINAPTATPDDVVRWIELRGRAVIMQIHLHNVRLNNRRWGCPYLPRDKCRNIINGKFDNGRILSADYLEITVTDVDFRIILDEYAFDSISVHNVKYARYGYLPRALIDCIIDYYKMKTELKNISGAEHDYMRAKSKLNSLYGMMAQDPCKNDIMFENGEFVEDIKSPETILDKNRNKAFLVYQWGVWCTAWARYRLEECIKIAGDNFIYCDTDSVKYIGDIDISDYNRRRIADSYKSGAYATDSAEITHYMGVYENDGQYNEFVTLGAKKYAYTDTENKLHVTIAGVNKKRGGEELQKIENFKSGFVFVDAGGTESVYNDETFGTVIRDGHPIEITANVVIRESTYTLGTTTEYAQLISDSRFYQKIINNRRIKNNENYTD